MESEKITVTVLSLAGCSATPGTIELIKKVAAEEKTAVTIDHLTIKTPEEAEEKEFIGSPSVRVNGTDIDPAAVSVKSYGLT